MRNKAAPASITYSWRLCLRNPPPLGRVILDASSLMNLQAAHRPLNTGLRFSKNAVRASLASSLEKAMRMLDNS